MDDSSNKLLEFQQISSKINDLLSPYGFECHPFLVEWYNEMVQSAFRLEYAADTVVFVIISTPSMFEKAILPFIEETKVTGVRHIRDPIDECMGHHVQQVKQCFSDYDIEEMYDFEMDRNRKPKILVQTAAHVAGGAYYYQRKDVANDPWDKTKNIYGVSYHPRFGGWFAMRGVVVFKHFRFPGLPKRAPPDVLKTEAEKVALLEKFNNNWQDWTEAGFRDVIPVEDKYSVEQIRYFDTKPKDRFKLLGIERENGADDALLVGHG